VTGAPLVEVVGFADSDDDVELAADGGDVVAGSSVGVAFSVGSDEQAAVPMTITARPALPMSRSNILRVTKA
jgi:hypothetical protein